MDFNELKRTIEKLLTRAVDERWSKGEFNQEIFKLASQYLNNSEFKAALYESLSDEAEFINKFSMTKQGREILTDIYNTFKPYYAKTKAGFRNGVQDIFTEALKKGEITKTIKNRIEARIGTTRNYAETITRTGIRGFDNVAKTTGDDENAEYEYTGPPAEREFCAHIMNLSRGGKRWTRKEIAALDNGQDLPCFMYGGGWNCRHHWRATGTVRKNNE